MINIEKVGNSQSNEIFNKLFVKKTKKKERD